MSLRPMERSTPQRPMNDAQSLYYYGRLHPMREPTRWERLLRRLGL